MFALLVTWWRRSFNQEERKRELEELFEKNCNYLEEILDRERKEEEENTKNGIRNYLTYATKSENDEKAISLTECSKRVGTITQLTGDNGFIDDNILFDIKVAGHHASELKVGVRVNYLLYKNSVTEHLTVIKIDGVIDRFWDQDEYEAVENKNNDYTPEYFETSKRNILGIIIKRDSNIVTIETEHKMIEVDLKSIKYEFEPKEGDRIYLCCKIQNDTGYVDRQGEILETLAMIPARIMTNEEYNVIEVQNDRAIMKEDAFVTIDIIGKYGNLNVGDCIVADAIESECGNFRWRCLNYVIRSKTELAEKNIRTPLKPVNENFVITVSENQECVFSGLGQKQTVEFVLFNNTERPMKALGITYTNSRRGDPLIHLLDTDKINGFEIGGKTELKIHFEVKSSFYGETREAFFIDFSSFRIKRSITLNVCEDEASAKLMRSKKSQNFNNLNMTMSRNNRSRYYANKVWSKRNEIEVVPGVSLYARRRFIARHIPGYDVPARLRDAYLTNDRKENIIDNIEGAYPYLREELSFRNYVQRFQVLLHLEEIEQFVNFRKYDRERANFKHEGEYLSLIVDGLAERRPSLVIGDIVRAINPFIEKTPSYDGVIHKVMGDKVLLKFNANFHSTYRNEDYRLEFYFSRFSFRKSHYATERIVKHLGEQFLFPTGVCERRESQLDLKINDNLDMILNGNTLKWFNPNLNSFQKLAVFNILRGEAFNMPYIIFGPPGTGKTVTIVETIIQLFKHVKSSRLLVGAPSNSGANLIATRLIESGEILPGDFVRLVSVNLIEQDLIPEHLMPYCATVDMGIDGTCKSEMKITESGLKLRCQMKYLGTHRITIGTCATLGNYMQMDFPPNHFSHVLIDEVGQCTEPETMIAITQITRSRGQVVLAGDPKQLQPVVINRYASEVGLSLSFLERILNCKPYCKDNKRFPKSCGFDPRLVTKLLYNYRALPSILKVYDEFFYDSELIPVIDPHNSKESDILNKLIPSVLPESTSRPIAHGTFFYGVRSENKQDKDSPSWFNMLEARNVFLFTIKLYRQNIKSENIGIITPYSKQVKYLRNMFSTASVEIPKIGTVEEFQGQERDVILISTVRSSSSQISNDLKYALGFVRCEKRMNVAISRARCLQVIFGNPHLLCIDPYWQKFIQYCIENDAYEGCDLPEDFYDDLKI